MEKKKELLFSITKDDLDISFFSGTGCGGQHRNKHMNAVHMKHRDSGVTATAQRERSREQNLRQAFESIINNPKFKAWHKVKCAELMLSKEEKEKEKRELDEKVAEQMKDDNIKIEVFENGKWVVKEITDADL